MPAVRTRSKRPTESLKPENDEVQSEDTPKTRSSRRIKDSGENLRKAAATRETPRRQAAKRKQQEDEPEKKEIEKESKKRRLIRRSNVTDDVEAEQPVNPRNARSRKSKIQEDSPKSQVVEAKIKKSATPKPALGLKKGAKAPEKTEEVVPNGRAKRSARKSTVELMDFDPDDESETDFSDNNDDDFVLPESEKSEEEEVVPEGDPQPEMEPTPKRGAPTRSKSKKSRSDKIREFLLDVDKSAPRPAPTKLESKVPPKKAEKAAAPATLAKTEVSVKPVRNKFKSSNRATISDDSDDSVAAPKKVKSTKISRVPIKDQKTFMKPRKVLMLDPVEDASREGSEIDTSIFEKSLLKLAKRMDDRESEGEEDEKITEGEEQEPKSAEVEETKEDATKTESEEAVQSEADKKLLILSMLKEHEPVDDMSDGSSDDDVDSIKKEESGEQTRNSKKVESKTTNLEENGVSQIKVVDKKEKPSEVHSQETTKKSTAKKASAKKKDDFKSEKAEESSESEDENWEVVEDAAVRDPNYKRPDNVTVVLQAEDFISDGKKGLTMEQRMIRLINRRRRGLALYGHRVHLLTLIAYQRWLNSIVENDFIKAYASSVLPSNLAMPGKSRNIPKLIEQLLTFYKTDFEQRISDDAFVPRKLKANLLKLLALKKTYCNITYLFGLLTLLRVCGIRSRLCLSYRLTSHRAVQLRVKDGEMFEVGTKTRSPSGSTGIDDYFVEIYFPNKKRWRPVDMERFSIIEDPAELNPHLEQPVSHLIGIDNDACMVDLSPKYNADWLNRVKTLRGDPKFFEEVLQRFAPEEKDQIEEKKEVKSKHDQQGLPKVISEYKNHSKYALRRHLLKHEAFYPRNPPVLGEIRGEPVYPRENVYQLHSRDQWYRKARSVKEGEEPYNVVTARPKFDRRKEVWVKDLPLEIFGIWQTERFKPPVVVEGKIPRNKYGNVDLFHPDMLPIGAAHLKLPMLNRVASDLGVDCVPACVGFDGLGRAFHAVYEGFVVCEEHKEMLEKAWHERQNEDRHTRRERIRTRAVRNWKMIIKKVIWDLRLKKKYKNNLEQE